MSGREKKGAPVERYVAIASLAVIPDDRNGLCERAIVLTLVLTGRRRTEVLSGLTSGTLYARLQRYFVAAGLPRAGVHVVRHSPAKLRRDAGESVEDVSRFLDHSSLAVTTTYKAAGG